MVQMCYIGDMATIKHYKCIQWPMENDGDDFIFVLLGVATTLFFMCELATSSGCTQPAA